MIAPASSTSSTSSSSRWTRNSAYDGIARHGSAAWDYFGEESRVRVTTIIVVILMGSFWKRNGALDFPAARQACLKRQSYFP
jgi:hypothetical protein